MLEEMYAKCETNPIKWAATQQNLSSGFASMRDSNKSPQLQTLSRIVKFCL